jgi:hypothetical protein
MTSSPHFFVCVENKGTLSDLESTHVEVWKRKELEEIEGVKEVRGILGKKRARKGSFEMTCPAGKRTFMGHNSMRPLTCQVDYVMVLIRTEGAALK